jgi:hypothetical protein
MKILLFDMDGVLLEPNGYHRALQETVRLAALSRGFSNVHLSGDLIAQFESLGISNEWHSSALTMALLLLEKQKRGAANINLVPMDLDFHGLFDAVAAQPLENPALVRAIAAITQLANKGGVDSSLVTEMVENAESISRSLTMTFFQELILGSDTYEKTYQKPPQLHTDSYLRLYDVPLISKKNAAKLLQWAGNPERGAAIMTNRPSNTLLGGAGTPEAEMGAALVGLEDLPRVGSGEMDWLAGQIGRKAGEIAKPAWQHALAAILSGGEWPVEKSLRYVGKKPSDWRRADLNFLHGNTITVFEDTPGGIISTQEAKNILDDIGIQIVLRNIGISTDDSKRAALHALGADVYPSINHALNCLDHF